MNAQFIFLGTGSSMGIPVIGCDCSVCTSSNNKDRRFRTSALVEYNGRNLLIDTGPDFREQALQAKLDHLDGVLFTHVHHDHTAGIDDLRIFHLRGGHPIPCLASKTTAEDLLARYNYMFKLQPHEPASGPRLALEVLPEDRGSVFFRGCTIRYFTYRQMGVPVTGFRFGTLAYVTDIKEYTDEIFEDLAGVKTLVISALRFTHSHMHLTVDEAVDFAARIGAKKTWITHIAHDLDHEKANAYLSETVQLAYDGLRVPFEVN